MTSSLRPIRSLLVVLGLQACAQPATDVAVRTMSMKDALQLTRNAPPPRDAPHGPQVEPWTPQLVSPDLPDGAQRPLLSTPDVRLAYLYEWVDPEGYRHFGEWVAIPVAGFHWIMSDGSRESIDAERESVPASGETP